MGRVPVFVVNRFRRLAYSVFACSCFRKLLSRQPSVCLNGSSKLRICLRSERVSLKRKSISFQGLGSCVAQEWPSLNVWQLVVQAMWCNPCIAILTVYRCRAALGPLVFAALQLVRVFTYLRASLLTDRLSERMITAFRSHLYFKGVSRSGSAVYNAIQLV